MGSSVSPGGSQIFRGPATDLQRDPSLTGHMHLEGASPAHRCTMEHWQGQLSLDLLRQSSVSSSPSRTGPSSHAGLGIGTANIPPWHRVGHIDLSSRMLLIPATWKQHLLFEQICDHCLTCSLADLLLILSGISKE